jgi:hypothetical protein
MPNISRFASPRYTYTHELGNSRLKNEAYVMLTQGILRFMFPPKRIALGRAPMKGRCSPRSQLEIQI